MIKEVFKKSKLFVFDMDGTIYLGNRVFPEAISFIKTLRKKGKKVLFFTNNASTNPIVYYERLERMGFEPQEGEIMTSGDVTVSFLKKYREGKKVFLLGTEDLKNQFVNEGITLTKDADIVVSSFDKTLTYEKLTIACTLIRNGAEFLCTHPDFNCPTENGPIPDSGAIVAAITASTGKAPRYFGKPYPDTLDMICKIKGVEPEEICVFGDRLYTDIALSKCIEGHPASSVLTLTGESTMEDVRKATGGSVPDIIVNDLAECEAAL